MRAMLARHGLLPAGERARAQSRGAAPSAPGAGARSAAGAAVQSLQAPGA